MSNCWKGARAPKNASWTETDKQLFIKVKRQIVLTYIIKLCRFWWYLLQQLRNRITGQEINQPAPKILNKDRSKPCLFTFFHRLAQAENKCKQMDFERSLLSIFEIDEIFSIPQCLAIKTYPSLDLIIWENVWVTKLLMWKYLGF